MVRRDFIADERVMNVVMEQEAFGMKLGGIKRSRWEGQDIFARRKQMY